MLQSNSELSFMLRPQLAYTAFNKQLLDQPMQWWKSSCYSSHSKLLIRPFYGSVTGRCFTASSHKIALHAELGGFVSRTSCLKDIALPRPTPYRTIPSTHRTCADSRCGYRSCASCLRSGRLRDLQSTLALLLQPIAFLFLVSHKIRVWQRMVAPALLGVEVLQKEYEQA